MAATGTQAASVLAQRGLIVPDPSWMRLLAPVREFAAEQELLEPEASALSRHFNALIAALPLLGKPVVDMAEMIRARDELPNIENVLAVTPPAMVPAELHERGWQWIQVGDTRMGLGNVTLASAAYRAAHPCLEAAFKSAPHDRFWRHSLAASWMKLGEVEEAKGNLPAAFEAYLAAKVVAEELVRLDPFNAEWGRSLSVC
jgi:tetratricopeptide (TPR) repeat protein